jgi:hypothetical protein
MVARNGLDWSSNFPAIVDAIVKLPAKTAIVDGEAVVLDDKGVSHFSSLQQAFAKGGGKARDAILYAFDLLAVDGKDLRREPLVKHKEALARRRRARWFVADDWSSLGQDSRKPTRNCPDGIRDSRALKNRSAAPLGQQLPAAPAEEADHEPRLDPA